MKGSAAMKTKKYVMWNGDSLGRIVETDEGEVRGEIFTYPVPIISKPAGWDPLSAGWSMFGIKITKDMGEGILREESNPAKMEFPRFFTVGKDVWKLEGAEGGSLTAYVWRDERQEWDEGDPAVVILKGEPITKDQAEEIIMGLRKGKLIEAFFGPPPDRTVFRA